MSSTVVFLGMGGTIAGSATDAADNVGYRAGAVALDQLLAGVPGLAAALRGATLESEQVAQCDSKDMDYARWSLLAARLDAHLRRPEVAGVVITHGTDTLEETAFFLASVCAPALLQAKPVVLTCAMRPASSYSPDGPQNLIDATTVACTAGACGVLVVCGGSLHGAQDVQKVHPYRLNPFDSGDAGPLGYVEEGVVRLVRPWVCAQVSRHFVLPAVPPASWPRVELILSYAGASAALVQALVRPDPTLAPLRGLVVAGTGNGTLHVQLEAALEAAIAEHGIAVLRATRCAWGAIVGARGPDSRSGAFAFLPGLSPLKSRIALMLELLSV